MRNIPKYLFILSLIFLISACGEATLLPPTASPTIDLTLTPRPSLTATSTTTPPMPETPGQHPHTSQVVIRIGDTLTQTETIRYLIYLPADYGKDPTKKWPFILYLHGSGERGSDLSLLLKQPLPKILQNRGDFPFIVVSPQLAENYDDWSIMIKPQDALIDQLLSIYAIDPQRLYLTGVSIGGFGAWNYALRYPQRFAAIVPIAGGYIYHNYEIPANLCDLKDLPVWAFHGALDEVVLPWQSQSLVEALKSCGGIVSYSEYSDLEHNVCDRVYALPELYEWMLSYP